MLCSKQRTEYGILGIRIAIVFQVQIYMFSNNIIKRLLGRDLPPGTFWNMENILSELSQLLLT